MRDLILSLRLKVGTQQLYRQLTNTILALVGVTMSMIVLFVQLGMQDAVYGSGVRIHKNLVGEIAVVEPTFRSIQTFTTVDRDMLEVAERYPGVEKAMPFYYGNMPLISLKDGSAQQILVYGIDPVYPALDLPGLADQMQEITHDRHYLYDIQSRPRYGDLANTPGEPDGLRILGPLNAEQLRREVVIGGFFSLGPNILYDGALITSTNNYAIAPGSPLSQVAIISVKLKPGIDPLVARDAIADLVGKKAMVLTKEQLIETEKLFWARETPIGRIIDLGLVVGLAIGILFVYQAVFQVIKTNIPEYAVLKSLGYSTTFFAWVVIQISGIVVLVSYIVGLLLSIWIFSVTEEATHLGMYLSPRILLMVLLMTAGMALASAFLALRRLLKVDPVTLFS
ncbi:FtsX-like permease family protein [Pararhodospirillum oryzae]|uniref:ABC3 transporter permease C-terminal domain-containing protein n=1 Tax=Pararhodospirillum oryzae TaxID=478448 RepID=A0A512HA91_9PROT|nr:FtsX-like permease family protein [Pararhodospirillum oryzae]GEO82310.1 hypothetical protein ROR02_24410 [Pararhodospirillum oryzae]